MLRRQHSPYPIDVEGRHGLQGIFVRQEDGHITKIFADQSVTVGDSTGLHASLQDVRFVGDSLYVFWVPANQVDSLDVFDASHPATEISYRGRTLFEGWMERAIPFAYNGDHYILGLGWVVTTNQLETVRNVPIRSCWRIGWHRKIRIG